MDNSTEINASALVVRQSGFTSAGIVSVLALLSYFLITYSKAASSTRQRLLPPGPKPKPVIGNLLDLPRNDGEVSPHYLKLSETYGPIISLKVFGQVMIIVNSHEITKDLLEKRSSKYSNRPKFVFAGEMAGFNRAVTLNQADDDFRQMRKFAHSHIGTDAAVKQWAGGIDTETRLFLLRLLDDPSNFLSHIRTENGTVLLKLVYDYQTASHGSDPLVDTIATAMSYFSDATTPGKWIVDLLPFLKYTPTWLPGVQFPRIAQHYLETLTKAEDSPYEFAKTKWSTGVTSPCLVGSTLTKGDSGRALTTYQEDLLKRVAISLYVGGADTTAAVMEVFFLAMIKNPSVLLKAQAEIDSVVGTSRLPSVEDRAQLPYCEAIIKESLRWEPVGEVLIPHVNPEDDEYNGYFIPRGSYVMSNLMASTHDPNTYNEPDRFKPERFLGDNPEQDISEITWGYGRRICPGRYLAMANLWLGVSRAIACFDIKAVKGEEPTGEFTIGLLRRPKPFKADITVRNSTCERLIREFGSIPTQEGDSKYLSKI